MDGRFYASICNKYSSLCDYAFCPNLSPAIKKPSWRATSPVRGTMPSQCGSPHLCL